MNLIELQHALRQLRLGGMASVLETRLRQAQAEPMAPIDLLSCLVSDELTRRADRLLVRRRKQAGFRDADRRLDNFDFNFNPKMNRSLVFDLATGVFIQRREDALFLGPSSTGKSHLAVGQAAIQQGHKVLYPEVPKESGQYSTDSARDSSKLTFRLLATCRVAHRPWPGVESALALAGSSDRRHPIGARMSRGLDRPVPPSESRSYAPGIPRPSDG